MQTKSRIKRSQLNSLLPRVGADPRSVIVIQTAPVAKKPERFQIFRSLRAGLGLCAASIMTGIFGVALYGASLVSVPEAQQCDIAQKLHSEFVLHPPVTTADKKLAAAAQRELLSECLIPNPAPYSGDAR